MSGIKGGRDTPYRALPYMLYLSILAFIYIWISGRLTWAWDNYEVPTLIGFAFFVILIAWMYGNTKPGFPGEIKGIIRLEAMVGNLVYRFRGMMVDISTNNLNDHNLETIKEVITLHLKEQISAETNLSRKEAAEATLKRINELSAVDLRKNITLYGSRRDFQRYVWVIVSDGAPDNYMFSSPYTDFVVPYGYVPLKVIYGIRAMVGKTVRMTGFGRVKVGVFIPTLAPHKVMEMEKVSLPNEFVENVSRIGAEIRTAVVAITREKDFKRRAAAYEYRINELNMELVRNTNKTGEMQQGASATSLWTGPGEQAPKMGKGKPPNYMAMLIAAVFGSLIFGTFLPEYVKTISPTVAAMIGTFAGGLIFLWLNSRRGGATE